MYRNNDETINAIENQKENEKNLIRSAATEILRRKDHELENKSKKVNIHIEQNDY